jgi:hypothetical protein
MTQLRIALFFGFATVEHLSVVFLVGELEELLLAEAFTFGFHLGDRVLHPAVSILVIIEEFLGPGEDVFVVRFNLLTSIAVIGMLSTLAAVPHENEGAGAHADFIAGVAEISAGRDRLVARHWWTVELDLLDEVLRGVPTQPTGWMRPSPGALAAWRFVTELHVTNPDLERRPG